MFANESKRNASTRFMVLGCGLGVVLLLSACSADAAAPASGTSAQSATTAGKPASANDTDLHFLAMMTPHHVQAVEMSDIVLAADGVSVETLDVAERIRSGQQEEIDLMLAWVADWNQSASLEEHSVHIANGMVAPERMTALAALSGAEIERTFLDEMIYHHEGAIAMTQDQIDNGGYLELRELAQQMLDVQTAEVLEMKQLLER